MTVESVTPTVFNPTIFLVTDFMDKRVPARQWQFIESVIAKHGYVFGSYYRSGEFWTEHVFVCPHCAHTTLLAFDNEPYEQSNDFYCKYCYTDWRVKEGRMLMVETRTDDDGNDIDEVLI